MFPFHSWADGEQRELTLVVILALALALVFR